MPSSTDLRRQAARCLRIAASFEVQCVVEALVAMADEFSAKADEIDPSLRSSRRAAADDEGAGGSGLAGM
jgi:hypothetical protein